MVPSFFFLEIKGPGKCIALKETAPQLESQWAKYKILARFCIVATKLLETYAEFIRAMSLNQIFRAILAKNEKKAVGGIIVPEEHDYQKIIIFQHAKVGFVMGHIGIGSYL